MRIVCQQTILMKYHALFVIKKKQNLKLSSAANIGVTLCVKLYFFLQATIVYLVRCVSSPMAKI